MFRDEAFLIDRQGTRYRLGETFRIGADPDASDLAVPDRADLSIVVHRQPLGAVLLSNLGANGSVMINGEQLSARQRTLVSHDVIEFANHRLQLLLVPPAQSFTEVLTRLAEQEPSLVSMKVAGDRLLERGHPLGPQLAQGTLLPLPSELQHAVQVGLARITTFASFIDSLTFPPTSPSWILAPLHATLRADVGQLLRSLQLPTLEAVYGLHTLPMPALRALRCGPCMDDVAVKDAERALAQFPFPRPLERVLVKVRRSFLVHEGRRVELAHGSDVTVAPLQLSWVRGLGFVPQATDRFGRVLVNDTPTSGLALLPGDIVRIGADRFTYEAE
ncbi:MAG: hypothetical protein ABTQ32_28425 [Myxococcaceae bacterium]